MVENSVTQPFRKRKVRGFQFVRLTIETNGRLIDSEMKQFTSLKVLYSMII